MLGLCRAVSQHIIDHAQREQERKERHEAGHKAAAAAETTAVADLEGAQGALPPEGTAALILCDNLYPLLIGLLSRCSEAGCAAGAAAATAACVNLSQQPAERLKYLAVAGSVAAAAACVYVDDPPELAEYAGMLLSNLTQLSAGVEQLLSAGTTRGEVLVGLLPRLAGAPLDASGERLGQIAAALTNCAQDGGARACLLAALTSDRCGSDGGKSGGVLMEALCGQLAAADATRRLVRNNSPATEWLPGH